MQIKVMREILINGAKITARFTIYHIMAMTKILRFKCSTLI